MIFDSGDTAELTQRYVVAGVLVDPDDVAIEVRDPAGVTTTYTYGVGTEVSKTSTGIYVARFPLDVVGLWVYRWSATGDGAGVDEGVIEVRPSLLTAAAAGDDLTIVPPRPTVEDVAALLHARTNVMGSEVGTFRTDTRPTAAQVERLIDLAANEVAMRVGALIPARYGGWASGLTALLAATLVEASFFPNEIEGDQSPYRQYMAMYLAGLEALGSTVAGGSALSGGLVVMPLKSPYGGEGVLDQPELPL